MSNLDDIFFYPRVYNLKTDTNIPEDAVNIMRPSKWGNPFKLSDYNNDRDLVLDLYEKWLYNEIQKTPSFLKMIRDELGGKHLVCCCHPKKCHGHILLNIANQS